jgi:hypothetical protein
MTVHEVVRRFVRESDFFTATELAAVLRAAGHPSLADQVIDDPDLVVTLVNEHT